MTGNFRIANMTGCRGLAAELANVPVDVLFRMGTRAARIAAEIVKRTPLVVYPLQNFVFRLPWVFLLRHHIVGNNVDQKLIYARQLKALGVDFLHVVTGYGFINPTGTPGLFPLEEMKVFCNATRHLSFKAAARATLINLIPTALFNVGWRLLKGSAFLMPTFSVVKLACR